MELKSVKLARVLGFVETGLLNPRGYVSRKDFVSALIERFSFMKFPTKVEDFETADKGILFKSGFYDGQEISEMAIYNDGLKVDLRSSTESGRAIMLDTLEWLKGKIGLAYTPSMINRWGYLSQIVVESELDLGAIHPALNTLAKSVDDIVRERTGESLNFRISGVVADYPKLYGDRQIASFSLERRVNTPDAGNLFYSSCPCQTGDHMRILEELEKGLKDSK